jgi:hypothetical protein
MLSHKIFSPKGDSHFYDMRRLDGGDPFQKNCSRDAVQKHAYL